MHLQVHTFLKFSTYSYRNEPIDILTGAGVLVHIYPTSAQNKSLISNTEPDVNTWWRKELSYA